MLSPYLQFVIRLQNPEQREAATRELAEVIGVKSILVFGRDVGIDMFLPAPGLVQTLRQGGRWQAFLNQCAEAGEKADLLPDPHGSGDIAVTGIADAERTCVFVFIEGTPGDAAITTIKELLPLLGPKLIDERTALAATGNAAAAREATKNAQALNDALDKNRQKLRAAVKQAEQEVAARRLAENKLREADRHKDDFLAMVSHELRNPLAAINNAVDLIGILGSDSDKLTAKAYQTIKRQARHLSYLVNDLLDISRISNGKLAIKRDRVLVSDFISAAVESVQPFIESRLHTLTITLPDEPLWLLGDAPRLSQVVDNLLHNAAKYTPPHGTITLTAEQVQDQLLIRVRDNGIGISQKYLPNIFSNFFQGEHTSDRVQDGLGVGLSLVNRLVELHGGEVTASSGGSGLGSLFTVRIPILQYVDEGDASPGSAPAISSSKRRRILLVDDNEDLVEMLKLLLEFEGHQVQTAHNGNSAIAAARQFLPEIVCLDIGLPDMDGKQVARVLRDIPPLTHAFLIAITGMGQEKDRQAGIEAGFDYYMVKPVDTKALATLVQSIRI